VSPSGPLTVEDLVAQGVPRATAEALGRQQAAPSLLSIVKRGVDLDRRVFDPLRFAVPGIIPEGMGILAGAPKVGKSFLILGIALACAAGGVALGAIDVGEPRPVLYLALEDGERRLQERCRRLMCGQRIPRPFDYVAGHVDPNNLVVLITLWLTDHPAGLVVLDTLGKVMPPAMSGETTYSRDYRIAGQLKALTDVHPGSCLIVVHHDRKAASDDFVASISGTHGLAGAADFVILLTRPRKETTGLLMVTGRDVIEDQYVVETIDGRWSLLNDSIADAAAAASRVRATVGLGETGTAVVELVTASPDGIRAAAIADTLDVPVKAVYQHLERAERTGRIVKPARGLYAPPDRPAAL
jgi:hypothetical protein